MQKWIFSVVVLSALWLFVGVEVTHREMGETFYEPFVKKKASLQFIFKNTALCGECDLSPWELMNEDARKDFAKYCEIRLGISNVNTCYADFDSEQQRITQQLQR